jgi:signal transduction histidine kinase
MHSADEHTRALWELAVSLSAASSKDQVCRVIIEQARATVGAYAGGVMLIDRAGTALEVCATLGYPEAVVEQFRRVALTRDLPAAAAFRNGHDLYVETPDDWRRQFSEPLPAASATVSGVALVLGAGESKLGVLTLAFREVVSFSERDRVFLQALAAECAQALERAELYDRERAARSEAERANRSKDEFLGALSHELRTPINAILGWTQLLRRHVLQGDDVEKALETIERNARLQAHLVSDLLDMSRIVAGKLHLDAREVHLGPLVSSVADRVRPAADAKRITLSLAIDPSVGSVLGDPDRLVQALWNVLSNAIKFTPKRGRVEVRLDQAGSSARVTVADNGQGIEPEMLPHMFDRLRPAAKTAEAGLGLGLAMVRHIVEAHGGQVGVLSDGLGRGAVFTFQLPLAAVSTEIPVSSILGSAGPDAPRLDGIRVVLVEDDPDSRQMEARLLSSYGADVRALATASEGWDALTGDRPDVLVADIGLPDDDGFALVRRLRAFERERSLARLPAIALTAFSTAEARKMAMLAGFNIHLGKPIEITELVTVVFGLAGKPH